MYSEDEPTHKLGDEHIIPLGIKGTAIVPDASCKKHETDTTKIEDYFIRHSLGFARPHLQLKGRKSKKIPTSAPFSAIGDRPIKIDASAHPGYMIDYTYPMPNFLSRQNTRDRIHETTYLHMRPLVPDFRARVERLGGQIAVKLGGEIGVEMFARLLAKVAHAYAVAERGYGTFEPWIVPLILGESSPYWLDDLVGSGFIKQPPGNLLHEVSFEEEMARINRVIIVRIRLFASLDAPPPAHYVIVGRPV